MKTIKNTIMLGLMGLMGFFGGAVQAQCGVPSNLTVSHVTGSAATVTWDYDTAAYGQPSGFAMTLTDTATGIPVSYTLNDSVRRKVITDLTERTVYRLALEAGCDTVSVLFSTPCNVGGETAIGDGTTNMATMPVRIASKYSISQQLFTAAEMADVDTVVALRFWMNSGVDRTRQVDVYLDTTSLLSYIMSIGNMGYLPQDSTHRHFSGAVDFTRGWVTITLDNPFVTTAGKGVVLTVVDHTGTTGGAHNFRITSTDNQMGVFQYRNTAAFDASSDSVMGETVPVAYRANIVFVSTCGEFDCLPPYLTDAAATTTSVALAWWYNGGSAWRVEYRHINDDTWTVAAATTYSESHTVGGLQPGNDYVFRVGNWCDTDSVVYSELSATTLCLPAYPVPFMENFEHFTASGNSDDMQHCWYRTSTAGYHYPKLSDEGLLSDHCLAFARRGTLVLPVLAAPVDSLGVTFWARNGNSDRRMIEVGVATDPADTATYVVVDTVTIGEVNNTWIQYTAYLDGLADSLYADHNHIFLRRADAGFNECYIDSLRVDYIPACRRLLLASVVDISDSAITVAVEGAYSHDSVTLYWWNTGGADSMTAAADTLVATGLTPDTEYFLSVRSRCGAWRSDGTPVLPQPVRTACGAVAVDDTTVWYNDLESMTLDCMWQLADDWRNLWANSDYSISGVVYPHSGGRHLRTAIRSGHDMLVLPTFDFSGLTENAELSFWHTQDYYNGSYWDQEDYQEALSMGFEIDTTGWHTPAMRIYCRAGGSGDWTLVTKIDSLSEERVWKKRVVTLPGSQGATVYQVGIMAFHDDEFIDDIRVGLPANACGEPIGVTVDTVTSDRAVVSWSGDAPEYSVQWRRRNSFAWQGITTVDTSATIAPLDIATPYEVRVQALCSEANASSYSDLVPFTTEFCDEVQYGRNFSAPGDTFSIHAPFYSQFPCTYTETFVNRSQLGGITVIRGFNVFVIDPGYQIAPWGDTMGVCGERFNDVDIYLALVPDSVLPNNFAFSNNNNAFHKVCSHCDLSFSDTGRVRVIFDSTFSYDGTSNLIMSVYQYIPTMGTSDLFAKFRAHAGDTAVTTVHSGFGAGQNTFMCTPAYLDAIPDYRQFRSSVVPDLEFLDCKEQCEAPLAAPVLATKNSITAGWYDAFSTVQVGIKRSSDTVWQDDVTVSSGNSYTFNGLEGMTAYDIRMRRVCGSGDVSSYVTLHAVTDTACPAPAALTVTEVSGTTATFAWSDSLSTAGWWELAVSNVYGFERYYDATTNPFTADGLSPNQQYRATVRAYCDASGNTVGDWSGETIFDNVCHPVTGLHSSSHDGKVYLNWEAGERNQRWIVTWGYAGDDRNQRVGYMTVDTTAATITGLTPGVSYGFRVVAVCGDGWQAGMPGAEVTATVRGVGIGDVEGSAVSLYPNPASKSVTVAGLEGGGTVEVLDVSGRSVASYHATETTLTIDVSGYARGTYFVRITDTTGCSVRKLVVR